MLSVVSCALAPRSIVYHRQTHTFPNKHRARFCARNRVYTHSNWRYNCYPQNRNEHGSKRRTGLRCEGGPRVHRLRCDNVGIAFTQRVCGTPRTHRDLDTISLCLSLSLPVCVCLCADQPTARRCSVELDRSARWHRCSRTTRPAPIRRRRRHWHVRRSAVPVTSNSSSSSNRRPALPLKSTSSKCETDDTGGVSLISDESREMQTHGCVMRVGHARDHMIDTTQCYYNICIGKFIEDNNPIS